MVAIAIVGALGLSASAEGQTRNIARELIVRYTDGVSAAERAQLRADAGATLRRPMLLPRTELIEVSRTHALDEVQTRLASDPRVARVERSRTVEATAMPIDPLFGRQWGLHNAGDHDVDAPEAWDVATGSHDVVVAVLDTGVETGHHDLAGNVWTNDGEVPANGVDDDGNGFADDRGGWDFVSDDATPSDVNGHGTHVAGTIGARGDNPAGVAGVSWHVDVMPVRVLDDDGFGSTADVADGIVYAARNGARVINVSLGGYIPSQAVRDAIRTASSSLVVAAAGNDAESGDVYPYHPCATPEPNVVCVTATDQDDDLAWFGNTGSQVDLAAPGVAILSTLPGEEDDYPDVLSTVDTFEGDDFATRWTTSGTATFTRTQERASGGSGWSITDSTQVYYANNANVIAQANDPIAADPARRCAVGFDLWRSLESGADYLRVEYSADGQTWSELRAFTGHSSGFEPQVAPLPANVTSFRLRFRMTSNTLIISEGVWIDDVRVRCRSGAPLLGTYGARSGTSMAAAHVAGAAALLLADDPALTVADAKTALMYSGDALPALAGTTASGRRLNVAGALGFETPTIGGAAATGTTHSRSTVSAAVDHRGLGGTWFVEYTPRLDHSGTLRTAPEPLPAGTGIHTLTRTLAGLEASATYDAKVVVETPAGRRESAATFTTSELPTRGEAGPPGQDGADGQDGVDGVDGKAGVNGTDGKDGSDGASGTNGKDGARGATGADGPRGADGERGAPGARGPRGRPGRDATVACRVRGDRVRCSVRYAVNARASVRVMRRGKTVRTLHAHTDRRGRLSFARRGLRGRYTLTVGVGRRSGRAAIRVE